MAEPHFELQYLNLLDKIWRTGQERIDRTGVGTRSIFGETLRFDLSGGAIPLLTTKKVAWKTLTRELLWFLTGDSNIRELVRQGVHIWTDWPLDKYRKETGEEISRPDFEARVLADDTFATLWGDLGPVYGVQWTRWPLYHHVDGDLYRRDPNGINQVTALVDGLRNNPASRRHIIEGWNVAEVNQMALPPCHKTYTFYVRGDRLDCQLQQRSADAFLGLPFNVPSAAILTYMIAQQTGLTPGELIWNGSDVDIHLNPEVAIKEQLSRTPAGLPKLRIQRKPDSIFDYRIEDFEVHDYAPQAHIAAPVAI